MKKVEEQTVYNFVHGIPVSVGNSTVTRNHNSTSYSLFGNHIAQLLDDGMLLISDAGWKTVTTKSRLNAILHVFNAPIRIFQKKGVWYVRDIFTGHVQDFNGSSTIDSNGNYR